jgi:hypothetical protein
MKTFFRHLIVVLVACCGSCRQPSVAPERVLSDLDQNGFIQSGWSVSIDDGDVHEWAPAVFAGANLGIRKKLRAASLDDVFRPITVRVIPEVSGYEVLILSRDRLSDEKMQSIRLLTEAAVTEAYETWISKAGRGHK